MDNLDYYRIEKAIQYLENNYKDQPDLKVIADSLHLSEAHFQKMFKKWVGISPKKFLQFLTLEYTKEKLKSSTFMNATYEAGLSSTSRLHELFVNIGAITPKEYRSMGKDLKIYYGFHDSQFGLCLIAITDKGICHLAFGSNQDKATLLEELKNEWANAQITEDRTKTTLYFNLIFKQDKKDSIPILLKGTNFQIQVWKALLKIPEGQLTTYENIAKVINNPSALRAVGTAVGSNHISYLIPCHRVINKVGIIGKYRWGSARKKAMIAWEATKNNN